VRQTLVQILGVSGREQRIPLAPNDLHRRLDLGKQLAERGEVEWIVADVASGLSEPRAGVGVEIVLARRVRWLV
jgi:hypothetical protein